MTTNLTLGRPARLILAFAVPLLIGNVVQQLYGFADAFVVGRTIGVDALAAVGATGGLSFLMLGFAWGLTSGLAIPTAHAFGAGDHAAVRRSVAAGAVLTAGFAVLLTAVAVPAARPLLELMHTPPEILADATVFIEVTFWGTAVTIAFNFLSSTIRALGDSRTPLVFLVVACGLNVALVFAFIQGLGMGVEGAALATVVSQLVSVLACLWLVRTRMPILRLSRADWRVSRADLAEQLHLGLPMGFQTSIIAIGTLVLQYAINGLGAQAVAAFTAAQRVDALAIAPMSSFGLALATFTAQNHGAQLHARIRQGVRQTCLITAAFSLGIAAVTILAGPALVRLFVGQGQEHVVDLAYVYLVSNGVLYVVLGLLFALRGTLQGLGRTVVPTVAGIMELFTRVAAALLLTGPLGFLGVSLAGPLAWVAAMIPLTLAWFRERRWLLEEERLLPLLTPSSEVEETVDGAVQQPAGPTCGAPSRAAG
ncbi:MATE family efflux transporter [Cellulomonas soli]